jgi:hypothetical protein
LAEGSKERMSFERFTKIFSIISIPAILFWVYSLYLRIDAYGFSVNRIVLLVIILWFLFNALYYVLSKQKSIRFMFEIFLGLMIVSFYFPFTAFYWGERAQISALLELASSSNYLEDGKINNFYLSSKQSSGLDSNEYRMSETINYIGNMYTLKRTEQYLSTDLAEYLEVNSYGYFKHRYYYSVHDFRDDDGSQFITIALLPEYYPQIIIPAGFKTIQQVSYSNYGNSGKSLHLSEKNESINIDIDLSRFVFTDKFNEGSYKYYDYSTIDQSLLSFELKDGSIFVATHLSGDSKDGVVIKVYSVEGFLFEK